MHAVVNHLPFKPDADWADIAAKFEAFAKEAKARFPRLNTAVLSKVSDTEGLFIGIYDDAETMQHVSANVAGPWFAENIRHYLAGEANRSVATVIAGSVAGG